MAYWMDPFSCLLLSPCSALTDLELLVLMYLLCSENLALKDLSDLVCMLPPPSKACQFVKSIVWVRVFSLMNNLSVELIL